MIFKYVVTCLKQQTSPYTAFNITNTRDVSTQTEYFYFFDLEDEGKILQWIA